jgi:hypothetical protein
MTTTNTELVGLLPCPFDAGEARWCETYIDNPDWGWIECNDCGASSRPGRRDIATHAWNTRAAGVEEG